MKYAAITERLAGLGGAKWEIHAKGRAMKAKGVPVIELTIGEPDVATPDSLKDAAIRSMKAGRTGYSNGSGEPGLLKAPAEPRYTETRPSAVWPLARIGAPTIRSPKPSPLRSPMATL